MFRRRRSAPCRTLWGAAAIALSAFTPARGQTVKPDHIIYDVKVGEDPAAKTCMLDLAIDGTAVGETVGFQLVVARTKRADALAGPVVFGFTIAVHGRPAAPKPEPRAIVLTSAAFTSARYVAAARPRSTPFGDGSWVATTFDAVEGSELLDAAADGKFQIAYTRTRPVAARVYDVVSAPPRDVLARLRGCVDGLQAIE